MEIQRKSLGYSLKAANQEEGVLEAIVNTLNLVDRTDERTMPGIFDGSLAKKMPRGVWHHDWSNPIAKTLEAREIPAGDAMLPDESKDYGGLYIKAKFFKEIEDSWQAFLKIKNGLIDEFSIGYRMIKTAFNEDDKILDLLEGEWFEWSPVLVGANQATRVLSLKDLNGGLSFEDHSEAFLDEAEAYRNRYELLAKKRLDEKGHLSQTHLDRLDRIIKAFEDLRQSAEPTPSLRAEFDREYLAIQKRHTGVSK